MTDMYNLFQRPEFTLETAIKNKLVTFNADGELVPSFVNYAMWLFFCGMLVAFCILLLVLESNIPSTGNNIIPKQTLWVVCISGSGLAICELTEMFKKTCKKLKINL